MMNMHTTKNIIASGAEASIIREIEGVSKIRMQKSYRIPEIDQQLILTRTRREANMLRKAHTLIPVPKLINQSDNTLTMEFLDGQKLRDLLDQKPMLSAHIAKNLTILHDNNIVHGDLTTSNMILQSKNKENKLAFIDFGLSFTSTKVEDKAVDIHLFKQALESKHHTVFEKAYQTFLDNYHPKERDAILKRLHTVEQRGRYKEKD